VISVLPTAGSVLAAALALLGLPTACMIIISLAKSTLPPGGSPPRAAVAGLGCVVLVSGLLSMTVFPLELGWHVLEEPVTDRPGEADAPSILLIVLDTVRADHLDFFGYPRETMPALTRFAGESCQVSQAILSTAASTLPAHGSMFTGHHSHTHGGHLLFVGDDQRGTDYGYPMRDDLPTLAEHLSGLGFQTAGIAANYAILSSYGLGRGFGHYDVVQGPGFWGPQLTWLYAGPTRKDSFGKFLSDHLPEPLGRRTQLFSRWAPPYRRAEAITDRALAWLGDRGDRPFFLFLNYLDAHRPYVPLPQYERRFTPEGSEVRWVGFLPGELSEPFMRGETSGPPPWREHLVGLYDAELAYLDDQLARLLDDLRRRTWWDNTLVMIVSDHGEAFTEHGLLEHGTSVYDTQVRVPLFIKFPAWMADAPPQVPPWFQFVDIYPSIMDMLGEEVPADIAGSPWGGQRGTALTQAFVNRYDVPWLDRELCAVMLGPHKYILSTTGEAELYNVAQDPGETRNLIGTRPEVEARARALIDQRNAEMVRQLSPSPEDAALHRNLRSLGYLQ
jgi:arylsulfatase A-like enzyme